MCSSDLYKKYEIEEQNNINIRNKFIFYRKILYNIKYHLKDNKFKYGTILGLYLLRKGIIYICKVKRKNRRYY